MIPAVISLPGRAGGQVKTGKKESSEKYLDRRELTGIYSLLLVNPCRFYADLTTLAPIQRDFDDSGGRWPSGEVLVS